MASFVLPVTEILVRERIPVKGTRALVHQNKPKGYDGLQAAAE